MAGSKSAGSCPERAERIVELLIGQASTSLQRGQEGGLIDWLTWEPTDTVKTCQQCGEKFVDRHNRKIFCSRGCYAEYRGFREGNVY